MANQSAIPVNPMAQMFGQAQPNMQMLADLKKIFQSGLINQNALAPRYSGGTANQNTPGAIPALSGQVTNPLAGIGGTGGNPLPPLPNVTPNRPPPVPSVPINNAPPTPPTAQSGPSGGNWWAVPMVDQGESGQTLGYDYKYMPENVTPSGGQYNQSMPFQFNNPINLQSLYNNPNFNQLLQQHPPQGTIGGVLNRAQSLYG